MISFQKPPYLIIDNIARCFYTNDGNRDNRYTLLATSLVCRSWRIAAIRYLFDKYPLLSRQEIIEIPPASLVPCFKMLQLNVDFPITDKIVEHLQHVVLDNASSLYIYFYHGKNKSKPSQVKLQQSNVTQSMFLDCIRRMIPNVTNVSVEGDCKDGIGRHSDSQRQRLFAQLFSSIVQLALASLEVIDISCLDGLFRNMTDNKYWDQQLVTIKLRNMYPDGSGFEIVRRNAETLQNLIVDFLDEVDDFPKLVTDKSGRHIVYSNLRRLTITHAFSYGVCDQSPELPDTVVPFPNLQTLDVWGFELASGDALFRGNYHSLKYLSLDLTRHTVNILTKHKVFSTCKYKELWQAKLEVDDGHSGVSISECARVTADIGRYARVLKVSGSLEDEEESESFGRHLSNNFSNQLHVIERLDFSDIHVIS